MKINFHKKGFMLIEVLIAISIIAASTIAIMAVAQNSLYVSRQSVHDVEAKFLLEEGAESARVLRDNAWSNLSALTSGTNYYPTFSSGTWTFSTTPNSVGIFTRTVTVNNVNRDNSTGDIVASGGTTDSGTKLITVTVAWPEGGNTVTRTLSYYISDIF